MKQTVYSVFSARLTYFFRQFHMDVMKFFSTIAPFVEDTDQVDYCVLAGNIVCQDFGLVAVSANQAHAGINSNVALAFGVARKHSNLVVKAR